jgi:hypothetical protein
VPGPKASPLDKAAASSRSLINEVEVVVVVGTGTLLMPIAAVTAAAEDDVEQSSCAGGDDVSRDMAPGMDLSQTPAQKVWP